MIRGAAMNAECKLVKREDIGDHVMFIGEVTEISTDENIKPLVYHNGKYWKLYIYKILKRHGLNILKCNAKTRTYKRFAMQHPNDMVQMDILGPFYLSNSNERNYFISCLDDCSRKVASKWSERKRTIDVFFGTYI